MAPFAILAAPTLELDFPDQIRVGLDVTSALAHADAENYKRGEKNYAETYE